MSLLDRLAGVVPRRERAGVAEAVIARHATEIAEARARGHSWRDIAMAAREAWKEEWPGGRKLYGDTLARMYNRIRKGL